MPSRSKKLSALFCEPSQPGEHLAEEDRGIGPRLGGERDDGVPADDDRRDGHNEQSGSQSLANVERGRGCVYWPEAERHEYGVGGNFIVNGLDTAVVEASDDNYIWTNVTSGKCYLGGYEYNQLVNRPIAIQKPRDTNHQLQMNPITKYVASMTYF